MMHKYAIYDVLSGEIKRLVIVDEIDINIQPTTGESYLIVDGEVSDLSHYIKIGTVDTLTAKTNINTLINKNTIINDFVDEIIISNIPTGTKATIFSDVFYITDIVNDGLLEFSTEDVGKYTIRLNHVEYLLEEYDILAEQL